MLFSYIIYSYKYTSIFKFKQQPIFGTRVQPSGNYGRRVVTVVEIRDRTRAELAPEKLSTPVTQSQPSIWGRGCVVEKSPIAQFTANVACQVSIMLCRQVMKLCDAAAASLRPSARPSM